jgi:hypothetical protein
MFSYYRILLLSSVLGLLTLSVRPALAQSTQSLTTKSFTVDGRKLTLPDWSKLTWGNLPATSSVTTATLKSDSKSSSPGNSLTSIDSILKLGDIQDFTPVSNLSLNQVHSMQPNTPTAQLTLNDFGILKNQTPATLLKALPKLGDLDISKVKPIQDLAHNLGLNASSGTVAQTLQSSPTLAATPLAELDLKQYQLESIPGVETTPLSAFNNWQDSPIKDVPGLNQIPWTKLSPQLLTSLLPGIIALADNYWSSTEHGDNRVSAPMFISGRVTCSGKTIPVAIPTRKAAAYLELSDRIGKSGSSYGKRIASGDDQQVQGGCGPLAAVNGGKEPTGWNAFGTGTFKLVLRNVDEQQEKAELWLYTHYCHYLPIIGKTCTPYFLPVAPVISLQHHDAVFLGTGN